MANRIENSDLNISGFFLHSLPKTLLCLMALAGFALASPAAAQVNLGQVIDPHLCAGDFNGSLSCVSNDIQINDVSQLGTPVADCQAGGTVTLDIQLTTLLNATGRYDVVVWFGKNGNNPRDVAGGACFASSLPDDPLSTFILDLESGGDSCLDVNSSTDPVIQHFYDVEVDCVDNFSPDPNGSDPDDVIAVPDGELDLFAVVTWGQSAGTLQCGDGTVSGEDLQAGTNPKCDAAILLGIDVVVIENPGLQLTKTGTLDDTVVPPSGVANPGDIINYTFLVENTGDVTISDITLADTVGGVSVSGGPIVQLGSGLIDSTTFTATYALTQADIDAGVKNNTATVTGDSPMGGPDDVTAQDVEAVNITQNNSVTLVKAASPGTYDTVGQVISYTYDVTNSGNTTLPGPVTVADDQVTVTCPALGDGNLDVGETTQCTASYAIVQADIDGGSVTNNATATVNGIDSNLDTETVNAVQNNSVMLVKGSSPATYDTVGASISYTYDVTNTGNTTLAGPATVADNQETVTCPALTTIGNNDGNLDPGETVQCTASHTVTQADIDSGSITNLATATVDSINSNQDTETVTAVQNNSVTLVKAGSPGTYDTVDQVISYTYDVTNSGNTTLAGPATVADDQETVTCPALTTIGNNDGNLDPSETVQCTASHTITQADIDNGSIMNTATATVDSVNSNQDMETVNAIQTDGITLTKDASPTTYIAVDEVISYTYDVTNTGNTTLAGPATVADDQETVTCPALSTVGNNDGNLDPDETVQCTASHTVTQADIDSGSITNLATATVDSINSNQDTETVTAVQNNSVTLVKAGSPGTYDTVGQVISYTYDVTNSGNTTLAGPVTVADDLETVTCPALSTIGNNDGNLDPDETVQCTASHTVVQADIDAGSITNNATATVNGVDSNPDSETINAVQNDSVTLVKGSSPATYDTVDEVISYTYDVTNTGNTTLAGPATVADDQETVTCPALTTVGNNDGNLDPDETVQCTASHTVTQADIDGGSLVNNATATVDGVDSNPDTETVNAVQTASLTVVKTGAFADDGNGDGFANAGETINFTFEVSNTGNVTVTNITITDNVAGVVVSGGPLASLAPGATDTTTFTATYVLTFADIINGFFSNRATGAGDSAIGPVQATATELVLLDVVPLVIPTMSQWAMLIMALLLMIAGWKYLPVRANRRR